MSLRDAVERTYFHFNPSGIVLGTSNLDGPILSRIVIDIEVNMPAIIKPPSSIAFSFENFCCTVTRPLIIVIIICAESHAIVWLSCKWVSRSDASKPTNSQWILISSTSHFKLIVVKVRSGFVFKFKIYSQFPLASLGETVYVFQSVPELSIEMSKSFLIVTPWSVKVHRTIYPPLYHCPSSICCFSITENISGTPFSSTQTLCLIDARRFSKEVKSIEVTTSFDSNIINGTFLFML